MYAQYSVSLHAKFYYNCSEAFLLLVAYKKLQFNDKTIEIKYQHFL